MLLFHRRKQGDGKTATKKRPALAKPIAPEELEEMNIEVLIKESLDMADKKLEILSEQRLGLAVEDFVAKEQNKAFVDAMKETLTKQQKKLIKRGEGAGGDDEAEGESGKVTSVADIRGIVNQESQQRELKDDKGTKINGSKGRKRGADAVEDDDSLPEKETEENDVPTARKNKATTKITTSSTRGRKVSQPSEPDASDSDDEVIPAPVKASSRSTARPRRPAARSKVNYNEDESVEDSESDAVVELDDDDDDSEVLEVQPKKRSKTTASTGRSTSKKPQKRAATPRAKSTPKPQKRAAKPSAKSTPRSNFGSRNRRATTYDDSDDDEVPGTAYSLDDDWGTANTNTER